MRLFFDTSAFIKRYVDEPGSERVLDLTSRAEELGLSIVILPESISTLTRLLRENRMTEKDYRALKEVLLIDLEAADLCELTSSVLEYTVSCLKHSPIRAMDAIHVGSALVYRPDLFISADRRQLEAAERAGLSVENANSVAGY